MIRNAALTALIAAAVVFMLSVPAWAQAPAGEKDAVEALVDLLREKGVLTAQDAELYRAESAKRTDGQGIAVLVDILKSKKVLSDEEAALVSRSRPAGTAEAKPPAIAASERDKEYLDKLTTTVAKELKEAKEQVRAEAREEAEKTSKTEIAKAVPEWTKRIRFGGDIRLRYQHDSYSPGNEEFYYVGFPNTINSTMDHDYFRYRVRLGMEATISDQLGAVLRLSTGNTGNPVSTNALLGDYMNKDGVVFDLAYLRWTPSRYLTLTGGRMPNPWFSTDLVWDNDLNFEGFAATASVPLMQSRVVPFLTAGAFPLGSSDFSQHDKWLTAGQVGVNLNPGGSVRAKLGAAYYYFRHITGVSNDDPIYPTATDWSVPQYKQKGNTLFPINLAFVPPPSDLKWALAAEFREINLTGSLDIGIWDPYHVILTGDYVKNIGYDTDEVARTQMMTFGDPNYDAQTTGYLYGISVGYPSIRNFAEWRAFFNYRYLERDAVVDAFTDSDFHLGGTNAKGWILGAEFGLAKDLWLRLRWLTADQISGPPLGIDVFQADVNARF